MRLKKKKNVDCDVKEGGYVRAKIKLINVHIKKCVIYCLFDLPKKKKLQSIGESLINKNVKTKVSIA